MSREHRRCLIIGSGPGGQRAAIQAAKLGKRVAVVEKQAVVGGVCTNTGTIPSKTFREAVVHLTGCHERGLYGDSYRVKEDLSIHTVLRRWTGIRRLSGCSGIGLKPYFFHALRAKLRPDRSGTQFETVSRPRDRHVTRVSDRLYQIVLGCSTSACTSFTTASA